MWNVTCQWAIGTLAFAPLNLNHAAQQHQSDQLMVITNLLMVIVAILCSIGLLIIAGQVVEARHRNSSTRKSTEIEPGSSGERSSTSQSPKSASRKYDLP